MMIHGTILTLMRLPLTPALRILPKTMTTIFGTPLQLFVLHSHLRLFFVPLCLSVRHKLLDGQMSARPYPSEKNVIGGRRAMQPIVACKEFE